MWPPSPPGCPKSRKASPGLISAGSSASCLLSLTCYQAGQVDEPGSSPSPAPAGLGLTGTVVSLSDLFTCCAFIGPIELYHGRVQGSSFARPCAGCWGDIKKPEVVLALPLAHLEIELWCHGLSLALGLLLTLHLCLASQATSQQLKRTKAEPYQCMTGNFLQDCPLLPCRWLLVVRIESGCSETAGLGSFPQPVFSFWVWR